MQRGYSDDKEAVQKRLRRIEGQVRGLQRMVDEDRYCIDVLEQVSAATRALQSVALQLLDDHWPTAWPRPSRAGRRGEGQARRGLGGHRPPRAVVSASRTVRRGPDRWTAAVLAGVGWLDSDRPEPPRGLLHVLGDAVAPRPGLRLSGAVQAFVSREAMQRKLGDHRPRPVVRASGLRDGLVVLLLRRLGDGQVAVRQGRRLRGVTGLHVRLDQPGHRARDRAGRAHGLAVRRRASSSAGPS